ncbi:hypothetical protein [Streptomyces sp. TRM49041]|uniref:hypothetical protein n=1 Tax=Streptomyces sp. TRM49041 TaxID=2603216 RepID=UPI00292A45C5|nr:hypothetical protein [Streptomyces sp. TRM49041]
MRLDATGLPVVAGPAEAAVLGNALVQARAAGVVGGGLPELRAPLRATQPPRHYDPAGDRAAWDEATDRVHSPSGPSGRNRRKEGEACA